MSVLLYIILVNCQKVRNRPLHTAICYLPQILELTPGSIDIILIDCLNIYKYNVLFCWFMVTDDMLPNNRQVLLGILITLVSFLMIQLTHMSSVGMTERLSNIRENIFMFVKTIYYRSCGCFLVLILLFVEDDLKQHLMLANLVACCSPFDDLPGFCTTKLTYFQKRPPYLANK